MTIQELAVKLNAHIEPEIGATQISHVAPIQEAGPGSLSFIANPNYERFLKTTKASALLVSEHFKAEASETEEGPILLRVANPYAAFAFALELFNTRKAYLGQGIDPHAVVSQTATLGNNVTVMAGAFIGDNVTIGNNTVIHPNAVIYDGCEIGSNCVIGPCTVIGFDGFGYVPLEDGTYYKIPQIGNVVIEDNVEIGASCTIDRATVSHTIIRKGVKLDNLIHIAHNVEIGENTVIAAQTGISGSAKLGKQNMIAGQVGMIGHIETADNVVIIAQSGVSKSLTKPGTYFGSPAKEHRTALKIEGAIRSLPELIERVKALEEALEKETQKD
jgi:UDP-3-O-[3-hydroxymyristoyl] glucosamine N-acyltransferase